MYIEVAMSMSFPYSYPTPTSTCFVYCLTLGSLNEQHMGSGAQARKHNVSQAPSLKLSAQQVLALWLVVKGAASMMIS